MPNTVINIIIDKEITGLKGKRQICLPQSICLDLFLLTSAASLSIELLVEAILNLK